HAETLVNLMDNENDEKASEEKIENEYEKNFKETIGETTASHEIHQTKSFQHEEQIKTADAEMIKESNAKETTDEAVKAVETTLQDKQELTDKHVKITNIETTNEINLKETIGKISKDLEPISVSDILHPELLQHEQVLESVGEVNSTSKHDINIELFQHEQVSVEDDVEPTPTVGIPYVESSQHDQKLTEQTKATDTEIIDESAIKETSEEINAVNVSHMEPLQHEQDLTVENMESLQHEQDLTVENMESLQHEQDLTREIMESLQHEQDLTRENIEITDTSAIDVPYPGSSHLEQELIKEQVKVTDIKKTEESATGLSSAIDVPYTEPNKELVEDQFKTADIEPIGEIPNENVVERESGHPVIDTLPFGAPE
ncbi:30982_t:CDS:1, partial [Racocetra persica]